MFRIAFSSFVELIDTSTVARIARAHYPMVCYAAYTLLGFITTTRAGGKSRLVLDTIYL